ncbi:hypothetical protein B0H19DRAFT_1243854 [Mycena capillaripes]|nr:hypothetical protein B0H19DRAFT_1243854 [Mycena capillaripes]
MCAATGPRRVPAHGAASRSGSQTAKIRRRLLAAARERETKINMAVEMEERGIGGEIDRGPFLPEYFLYTEVIVCKYIDIYTYSLLPISRFGLERPEDGRGPGTFDVPTRKGGGDAGLHLGCESKSEASVSGFAVEVEMIATKQEAEAAGGQQVGGRKNEHRALCTSRGKCGHQSVKTASGAPDPQNIESPERSTDARWWCGLWVACPVVGGVKMWCDRDRAKELGGGWGTVLARWSGVIREQGGYRRGACVDSVCGNGTVGGGRRGWGAALSIGGRTRVIALVVPDGWCSEWVGVGVASAKKGMRGGTIRGVDVQQRACRRWATGSRRVTLRGEDGKREERMSTGKRPGKGIQEAEAGSVSGFAGAPRQCDEAVSKSTSARPPRRAPPSRLRTYPQMRRTPAFMDPPDGEMRLRTDSIAESMQGVRGVSSRRKAQAWRAASLGQQDQLAQKMEMLYVVRPSSR